MSKQNYMELVEIWLDELLRSLEPGVEIADVKAEIKKKILESFRNGQRSRRSEKVDSSETK